MKGRPKGPTKWPHTTFQQRIDAAKRALVRLEGAENADDRPEAQDLALAACSAAWHLADALWHDGVSLGFTDFETLKHRVTQARPAVATVRDIGEFAKHVMVNRRSTQDLGVETSVGAHIMFGMTPTDHYAAQVVRSGVTTPAKPERPPELRLEADPEPATPPATHRPLRIKVVFPDGRRIAVADVVREAIANWETIHGTRTL